MTCREKNDEDYLEETEYFKKIYYDSVDLINNERKVFKSYRTVESSNLTIGFNSTLITEAFGMGTPPFLLISQTQTYIMILKT